MKLRVEFSIGFVVFVLASGPAQAWAGGGPLGIGYRLSYDDSGIPARTQQKQIIHLAEFITVGGALLIGGASTFVLKRVFQIPRLSQVNDPNLWFQGCCANNSFRNSEVTSMAAIDWLQ